MKHLDETVGADLKEQKQAVRLKSRDPNDVRLLTKPKFIKFGSGKGICGH
jgi:hypothetical protein